ncbi:hypothetical protein C8R47DRAFT_1229624 [Mycena vitilis]|nr:hypothetical protein C8R47DRAFT_1229624 [Mycena vitilis]
MLFSPILTALVLCLVNVGLTDAAVIGVKHSGSNWIYGIGAPPYEEAPSSKRSGSNWIYGIGAPPYEEAPSSKRSGSNWIYGIGAPPYEEAPSPEETVDSSEGVAPEEVTEVAVKRAAL